MKRHHIHILLYIAFLLSVLLSCGPGGESFRIKGRFRDMQTGELYIYNLSADHARLDTLNIQGGRFLYRGETSTVTPYILLFPNGMEQVIFVGPGEDLEYEATANDMKNYVVNGSEENTLMNKFRQETYTMNPSSTTGVARTYIRSNPTSLVALYLFDRYFVQDENVSDAETAKMLKALKPHHPHNHYLLDIENKLTARQQLEVGATLPDVTLIRPDLTPTKLWTLQSDYTLLAFWATWLPDGYNFLWRLRRDTEAHLPGGKLRVLAISLDTQRHRWEETARQDTLTGIEHYCDGLSLESPILKSLGITQLPSFILVDRRRQVIASGTDASQLTEVLKKNLQPPTP